MKNTIRIIVYTFGVLQNHPVPPTHAVTDVDVILKYRCLPNFLTFIRTSERDEE